MVEWLSRVLDHVEKGNYVSSYLCQKCKRMEKMWCLTDTAGKFREKHENQRRSKPNYANTKACNEAQQGDYQQHQWHALTDSIASKLLDM